MRINNNLMAMNAHRQLGVTNTNGSKSMEKLSSGYRINRAGDDAAGLSISEKMRAQIRGLNQASRNAQDGISLIQTAEGALSETHAILQRMRELAVQSANDTNQGIDRAAIQDEINELATEITRISTDTEFNNQTLLDGNYNDMTFHIGANKGQSIKLSISDMSAEALGVAGTGSGSGTTTPAVAATGTLEGVDFEAVTPGAAGNSIEIEFVKSSDTNEVTETTVQVTGNKITVTLAKAADGDGGAITSTVDDIVDAISKDSAASALVTATGSGTDPVSGGSVTLSGGEDEIIDGGTGTGSAGGIDVSSATAANDAIETINEAIKTVSAERSKLGAYQNRLEHTIKNLDTSSENLQASESRIRDVDMAQEIMEFTKNNILQQAATAMLAQANQAPQGVLQLLR